MRLETVSDSKLDEFVRDVPDGSFFHTSAWRSFLIRRGYEPSYFVVRNGAGLISALLPYFFERVAGGLGFVLNSMPGSDVGGPLFAAGAPVERICQDFLRKGRRRRVFLVNSVGISNERVRDALLIGNSRVFASSGFFVMDLQARPTQQLWNDVYTREYGQRKHIRKAESMGLKSEILTSKHDFDTFCEIYATTIRNAGGKPRSRSYLSSIWTELGPDHFKVMAMKDQSGNLVAGLGFHLCRPRGSVNVIYSGYTPLPGVHLSLANYWSLMLWCERNGFPFMNLGTTPDDPSSGLYAFKQRLGGKFVKRFNITNVVIPRPLYLLMRRMNWLMRSMRDGG